MRDRDDAGRPRNARPRDALGRPLPVAESGVTPLPDDLDVRPENAVAQASGLVEKGLAFQAHEVLEAVWKSSSPPARVAWQGMAQLAVALTHAQRGNLIGAARLRERARDNLADGELPAVADALRARLEALIDAVI